MPEQLKPTPSGVDQSKFVISIPKGQEEQFRELVAGFSAARVLSDQALRKDQQAAVAAKYQPYIDSFFDPRKPAVDAQIMQNFNEFFSVAFDRELTLRAYTPEDQTRVKTLFHQAAQEVLHGGYGEGPLTSIKEEAVLIVRWGLADGVIKRYSDVAEIFGSTKGAVSKLASDARSHFYPAFLYRASHPDSAINGLAAMMTIGNPILYPASAAAAERGL